MIHIDAPLVKKLIASQFPHWASLPITPVETGGWDNRTFHLGNTMLVRLPSAECYADKVAKEQAWLPRLAQLLPLPIPAPLALGKPGEEYPFPWSIYAWIDGETAAVGHINDLSAFAQQLAQFLQALESIDTTGAPVAGPHNFYRGGSLKVYDAQTQEALAKLTGKIDTAAAHEIWDKALSSTWEKAPVLIHGDVHPTNMLVKDGKLHAIIDFGGLGSGDPACDLVMAWTFFKGESRTAFYKSFSFDKATWERARGWALWKALIVYAELPGMNPAEKETSKKVLAEIIHEYQAKIL